MVPSLPAASSAWRQTRTAWLSWAASRSWYSARSLTPCFRSGLPAFSFTKSALSAGSKSRARTTSEPGSTRRASTNSAIRLALCGMLGAPFAAAAVVGPGLVVAVALDLLPVGAAAVVVVDGVIGIRVGVERGHRRRGSILVRYPRSGLRRAVGGGCNALVGR